MSVAFCYTISSNDPTSISCGYLICLGRELVYCKENKIISHAAVLQHNEGSPALSLGVSIALPSLFPSFL